MRCFRFSPALLGLLLGSLTGNLTYGQTNGPSAPAMQVLVRVLQGTDDPAAQLNILRGMNAGLKGQRNVAAPADWPAVFAKLQQSSNPELREQAQALGVTFGAAGALDDLRKVLADRNAPLARRKMALESLITARDAESVPLLLAEVQQGGPLRGPSLRSLAGFDAAPIPGAILGSYAGLPSDQKRDALATLTTRGAWARELLQAVDDKRVPRSEITAPLARQLQDLKDDAVNEWLTKNWGTMHTTSAEKQKEIARFKTFLTPPLLQRADASHGRAIFAQTCSVCHTVFGAGAKIGPELPGAFEDIDYLLQNILDPNAIIGKDYQQTVVQTKDGQTIIGIVGAEEGGTLTLKSLGGPVTIQRADIVSRTVLDVSLMPEGLLTGRSEQDVRDLFAYLGRHGQVPMLADAANINDFFNGADLTRWNLSSPEAWKVENGEIVGKGRGDRAEFVVSDLVAGAREFSCELSLTGNGAVGEVVINGIEGENGMQAEVLRIQDGKAGPAIVPAKNPAEQKLWELAAIPVEGTLAVQASADEHTAVLRINGAVVETAASPNGTRTVVSFRVKGDGAELRVRKLRLSLPGAAPAL